MTEQNVVVPDPVVRIIDNTRDAVIQTGGEIPFMTITPVQAPFLVGMKGRNISLIRKCSGMIITIKGDTVFMAKQRSSGYKPDLAVKMVLSACTGGILRWFVTQKATTDGYPFDKIYAFELLAQSQKCTLKLLRARSGHMCLMLIPELPEHPTAEDYVAFKEHIGKARVLLMEALAPSPPIVSILLAAPAS